jgi:tetratricopeptide (TPR) repeat protein
MLRVAVIGLVAVYTTGFLLWYSATPLGLYPILDGREALQLALRMANGDLPAEPFYRAPLYPALLALTLHLGVPYDSLPIVARGINGLCHLVSTVLVWRIAAGTWRRDQAGLVAAGLFGFNPLLLHFAADPLDLSLGVCLMLAGVGALVMGWRRTGARQIAWAAAAGFALALAVTARPHFLTVLCCAPLIAALWPGKRGRVGRAAAVVLPAAIIMAAMGMANQHLSGDFRLLPWQGAYNLWAANKPGANGRYFDQTITVHSYDETINPARVEAETLYRQAHPADPGADYQKRSQYWRRKALDYILASPVDWLALIATKTYYLINNFEQYNNKTYWLHKSRSHWLRPNPICWSLILALGVWGAFVGWRWREIRTIVACATMYALGVLLFYASARFRAPLIPLLAICAGGLVMSRDYLGRVPLRLAATAMTVTAGLAAISLLPIAESERTRTLVQDYLGLSRAAGQVGLHGEALEHARAAASIDPQRFLVRDALCVTRFNAWLYALASAPRDLPAPPAADACEHAAADSAPAARILGHLYWRAGRGDDAVRTWRALLDRAPSDADAEGALAALVMVNQLRGGDIDRVRTLELQKAGDTILLALLATGERRVTDELGRRFSDAELRRQLVAYRGLFANE